MYKTVFKIFFSELDKRYADYIKDHPLGRAHKII